MKLLERTSSELKQSQIFIETPYRNNKLVIDICKALHDQTLVCIACDITLSTEYIKTKTVSQWSNLTIDLNKRPAIFIIQKP